MCGVCVCLSTSLMFPRTGPARPLCPTCPHPHTLAWHTTYPEPAGPEEPVWPNAWEGGSARKNSRYACLPVTLHFLDRRGPSPDLFILWSQNLSPEQFLWSPSCHSQQRSDQLACTQQGKPGSTSQVPRAEPPPHRSPPLIHSQDCWVRNQVPHSLDLADPVTEARTWREPDGQNPGAGSPVAGDRILLGLGSWKCPSNPEPRGRTLGRQGCQGPGSDKGNPQNPIWHLFRTPHSPPESTAVILSTPRRHHNTRPGSPAFSSLRPAPASPQPWRHGPGLALHPQTSAQGLEYDPHPLEHELPLQTPVHPGSPGGRGSGRLGEETTQDKLWGTVGGLC